VRNLFPAGRAPGAPEIDDRHLAFGVGQLDRLVVHVGQLKVERERRLLRDQLLGFVAGGLDDLHFLLFNQRLEALKLAHLGQVLVGCRQVQIVEAFLEGFAERGQGLFRLAGLRQCACLVVEGVGIEALLARVKLIPGTSGTPA
jgi:hypothetical protein